MSTDSFANVLTLPLTISCLDKTLTDLRSAQLLLFQALESYQTSNRDIRRQLLRDTSDEEPVVEFQLRNLKQQLEKTIGEVRRQLTTFQQWNNLEPARGHPQHQARIYDDSVDSTDSLGPPPSYHTQG